MRHGLSSLYLSITPTVGPKYGTAQVILDSEWVDELKYIQGGRKGYKDFSKSAIHNLEDT
jgi:hypothetical protein